MMSDSRRSTPTSPGRSRHDHHHSHDKDDQMRGSNSNSTSGAGGTKYDDPPNSRLFIVCGRQITEDQFKEGFGVFGKIEEIWLVKDRVSKAPKGIAYIKVQRWFDMPYSL